MNLNPYLTFKGECEAAFKFYENILGGKIEGIMKYAMFTDRFGIPWMINCE
jgi:PhnB protein